MESPSVGCVMNLSKIKNCITSLSSLKLWLPRKVEKPWGYYIEYFRSNKFVIKKLVINPYQCLSLQYHNHRKELWFISNKSYRFYRGYDNIACYGPSFWKIDLLEIHSIENISSKPIKVFELQYGTCYEDDIIRIKDKYGR